MSQTVRKHFYKDYYFGEGADKWQVRATLCFVPFPYGTTASTTSVPLDSTWNGAVDIKPSEVDISVMRDGAVGVRTMGNVDCEIQDTSQSGITSKMIQWMDALMHVPGVGERALHLWLQCDFGTGTLKTYHYGVAETLLVKPNSRRHVPTEDVQHTITFKSVDALKAVLQSFTQGNGWTNPLDQMFTLGGSPLVYTTLALAHRAYYWAWWKTQPARFLPSFPWPYPSGFGDTFDDYPGSGEAIAADPTVAFNYRKWCEYEKFFEIIARLLALALPYTAYSTDVRMGHLGMTTRTNSLTPTTTTWTGSALVNNLVFEQQSFISGHAYLGAAHPEWKRDSNLGDMQSPYDALRAMTENFGSVAFLRWDDAGSQIIIRVLAPNEPVMDTFLASPPDQDDDTVIFEQNALKSPKVSASLMYPNAPASEYMQDSSLVFLKADQVFSVYTDAPFTTLGQAVDIRMICGTFYCDWPENQLFIKDGADARAVDYTLWHNPTLSTQPDGQTYPYGDPFTTTLGWHAAVSTAHGSLMTAPTLQHAIAYGACSLYAGGSTVGAFSSIGGSVQQGVSPVETLEFTTALTSAMSGIADCIFELCEGFSEAQHTYVIIGARFNPADPEKRLAHFNLIRSRTEDF